MLQGKPVAWLSLFLCGSMHFSSHFHERTEGWMSSGMGTLEKFNGVRAHKLKSQKSAMDESFQL